MVSTANPAASRSSFTTSPPSHGYEVRAPHGGIFVLPLIGKPLLFVVALVVGTLISTVAVILLKQLKAGTSRGVEPAVGATAVSARLVDRTESPLTDDWFRWPCGRCHRYQAHMGWV